MIDLVSYRVRIGLYNNKSCRSMKMKNKSRINSLKMYYWRYIMILTAGIFCVTLLCQTETSPNFCAVTTKEQHNFVSSRDLDVGLKILYSRLSPKQWNSVMKAVNGNRSNRLNIAHWNGGSSHLGKSSKGKEKLQHVKFLLNKYGIDVFGLSEANVHNSVDNIEIKLEKYKTL